jgi:hypothetical protein
MRRNRRLAPFWHYTDTPTSKAKITDRRHCIVYVKDKDILHATYTGIK